FDLQTFRFKPAARAELQPSSVVERQPLTDWFYQRQWQRLHRLRIQPTGEGREVLVVCSHERLEADTLGSLQGVYRHVIEVQAGNGYQQLGPNRYELDPLDPVAFGRLIATLDQNGQTAAELDWLHALPLSVGGAVDEQSLTAAQWACLDTLSALLQAWGQSAQKGALRLWLLSWQACPVNGPVMRPELAALAGITEVA
ncbi:hypothetical protein CCL07_22435, partial [Pseudomonas congelans]